MAFLQNNFTINNQASVENVVLDFSQGYSTTHLQVLCMFLQFHLHKVWIQSFIHTDILIRKQFFMQGRSVYQEQYGFFMPSLLPENQLLVQNQLSH